LRLLKGADEFEKKGKVRVFYSRDTGSATHILLSFSFVSPSSDGLFDLIKKITHRGYSISSIYSICYAWRCL